MKDIISKNTCCYENFLVIQKSNMHLDIYNIWLLLLMLWCWQPKLIWAIKLLVDVSYESCVYEENNKTMTTSHKLILGWTEYRLWHEMREYCQYPTVEVISRLLLLVSRYLILVAGIGGWLKTCSWSILTQTIISLRDQLKNL